MPKRASPQKGLTALEAAELVLRKFANRKPMHCRDITRKAIQKGWLASQAKRPDQQLLYRARQDIKKREERGDSARFTIPDKGYLGLAKWERKSSPARSKKTADVIYVLSNPAMEGLLKIGKTTKDLKQRMGELYDTGVPFPFRCEHARKVDDADELEKWLQRILRNRVNPKREFYQLDVEDVINALQGHGEDVTPAPSSPDSHGTGVSRPEIQSGQRIRQRGPRLQFSELRIPRGATLVADHPRSDEKCTVVRDDCVKFRGREMTFTSATKRLLGNPTWQPRPARHWRYREKLLVEIYNEKYFPQR